MNNKTIKIGIMVLMIVSSMSGIASANESRSETFVNSYIDSTQGFYKVEQFYVDYNTHEKVDVRMVTVSPTNIVLTNSVILEYVNTASVPLTVEMKNSISGDIVFTSTIKSGYEFTYTFDGTGVYDVYIKEYPELKHQLITTAIAKKQVVNPPEIKSNWSELPKSPSNTTSNSSVVTPVATVVIKPLPIVVSTAIINSSVTKQPCDRAVCYSINKEKVLDASMQIAVDIAEIGVTIWHAFGTQ